MNQPSKTARTGVFIYRLAAIASLALTLVLFPLGGGMTRTIVFVAWFALCLFTCIRMVGDVMSKAHLKAQRFDNTLKAFQENTGSPESAVKSFYLMIALSSALKLAVPVVLWLIFR